MEHHMKNLYVLIWKVNAYGNQWNSLIMQAFGRTPLTSISPKKTWEGTIAGLGGCIATSVVLSRILCWPKSLPRYSIFFQQNVLFFWQKHSFCYCLFFYYEHAYCSAVFVQFFNILELYNSSLDCSQCNSFWNSEFLWVCVWRSNWINDQAGCRCKGLWFFDTRTR